MSAAGHKTTTAAKSSRNHDGRFRNTKTQQKARERSWGGENGVGVSHCPLQQPRMQLNWYNLLGQFPAAAELEKSNV
jgi:hypothetical protein